MKFSSWSIITTCVTIFKASPFCQLTWLMSSYTLSGNLWAMRRTSPWLNHYFLPLSRFQAAWRSGQSTDQPHRTMNGCPLGRVHRHRYRQISCRPLLCTALTKTIDDQNHCLNANYYSRFSLLYALLKVLLR